MYIKYKIEYSSELFNHLWKNGYDFGFDKINYWLFVNEKEKENVETLMKEHKVNYRKEEK